MRIALGAALITVTVVATGCSKTAQPTADSAAASSTSSGASFDKDAARREILANDSTFIRGMLAKNVDTVMCCYDNDAVSLGSKMVKGTSELRKSYTEGVKANARDINFQSSGVNFSDDGTMAWDYGTFSQTVDVKGKATKEAGNFLNVWKKVDGKWKIVAEISTPTT